MNIAEAKEEIRHTLAAYLQKNEYGSYRFPVKSQRPILMIGPPGIGKTAILDQVAEEAGVLLVSYTMTHHTRQSVMGLPMIRKVSVDGEDVDITSYTRSELLSAMDLKMEETGIREGILFLDEINCVSDTLSPLMLELLQNKTFGNQPLPAGWIIVAAGNPESYNRSARNFDIATLDRVREIDVEADVSVWLTYAKNARLHRTIITYLEQNPDRFYRAGMKNGNYYFVTARGWEDLSHLLELYEELEVEVTKDVILEYLQDPETAGHFYLHYTLYRRLFEEYSISRILAGEHVAAPDSKYRVMIPEFLLEALHAGFVRECDQVRLLRNLGEQLLIYRQRTKIAPMQLSDFAVEYRRARQKKEADFTGKSKPVTDQDTAGELDRIGAAVFTAHPTTEEETWNLIREEYQNRVEAYQNLTEDISKSLEHAILYLREQFSDSQEPVLFLSGLLDDPNACAFLTRHEHPAFLRLGQQLLLPGEELF